MCLGGMDQDLRVSRGGGSLFPCSLTKLPYVPMFPHIFRMFSYCNFSNFVPLFSKIGECSLVLFDILPMFPCSPKPLGDPQIVIIRKWSYKTRQTSKEQTKITRLCCKVHDRLQSLCSHILAELRNRHVCIGSVSSGTCHDPIVFCARL